MVYIIEVIILETVLYMLKDIRDKKFYNWVLKHNKYVFDAWAETKERFAYKVTKIVDAIPSFSFAPTSYDYYRVKKDWYSTNYMGEKFLIAIGTILLHVKGIVGNVLIDLAFVLTFLIKNKYSQIKNIINIINKIDFRTIIDSMVNGIFENGNVLLIIMIIFLAIYALYERKKIVTYRLEAVWGKDATNVEQVAERQKRIENILLHLMEEIYQNSCIIKQNIRLIDAQKYTNDNFLIVEYEDFTNEIDEIKKLVAEIRDIPYGMSIYIEHNRKALVQLEILELFPSKNIRYIELDECNKPALLKINSAKSDDELKSRFMDKWMHCIAQVNGIIRYLRYMNKKMVQYQKLLSNITDVKELKEIMENVKS